MEMPGPWKAWKSKSSFSPLSTAPWESRQRREIPTFPQPGMPRMGKWKTKIRFPTFPRGACDDDRGLSVFRTKNQERRSARFAASSITFFRIHARLETELCFRIILRLENADVGSFTERRKACEASATVRRAGAGGVVTQNPRVECITRALVSPCSAWGCGDRARFCDANGSILGAVSEVW